MSQRTCALRTGRALVPSARSPRRCVSESAGEDGWSWALRGGREEVREAGFGLCVLATWRCWWRRGGKTTQTLLKWEFGSVFHRVVLSQLDYLRAGKNAETLVKFKTSLWMRPGWTRACFWTWLRYIRAGIWSCAAFTQNSDKLFLAASFSPSCFFCLLLSDPTLVFGFF